MRSTADSISWKTSTTNSMPSPPRWLTEIFGVGPILAATILGTVGDAARFPTKAHFASYSDTAPVETSSGDVVRHRLSLAGN
jgi:transposase